MKKIVTIISILILIIVSAIGGSLSWKRPLANVTWYSVSRPINSTAFTPSTSQNVRVFYTVELSCTASIGSNAAAAVTLQFSTDGQNTWQDATSVKNSNTVTLAVTLQAVTIQRTTIAFEIPAGAVCRMVTSTTGTATATYINGWECAYDN